MTLSLDRSIRFFDEEGNLVKEQITADPILNGSTMPNRQDNFIISMVNDETQESHVAIYRKHFLKKEIGPFTDAVLDLKVSQVGSKLFIPKELIGIECIDLIDFMV